MKELIVISGVRHGGALLTAKEERASGRIASHENAQLIGCVAEQQEWSRERKTWSKWAKMEETGQWGQGEGKSCLYEILQTQPLTLGAPQRRRAVLNLSLQSCSLKIYASSRLSKKEAKGLDLQ